VNGEQLHELARDGRLPDEMPTKEVEIYSIEILGRSSITADELKRHIFMGIDLVKGDFRQEMIKRQWNVVLNDGDSNMKFEAIKIRVKCSSGTYMRSLADRIGRDNGTGAFALAIKRTEINLE
jgi:tRNA U55 pseudouridine synthase TruB